MSDRPQELTLAEQSPASHECRACGYVYDPNRGDGKNAIPAGTPFEELPETWRCPVCGVRRSQFINIGARNAPSGFRDNLDYGFGVNRLTPNQKSILIFGTLGLFFLFFMSLYGLN
jgi:rubredoxin